MPRALFLFVLAFRAGALVAPARTMAMLRVANCPSQDLALTNAAFVNAADAAFVPYAELGDLVLFCKPHDDVEKGTIALNGVQRKLLRVSTGDTVRVEPFTPPVSQFNAAGMTLELEFTKLRTATDLNAAGRHEQVRIRPFPTHPSPDAPASVSPSPPPTDRPPTLRHDQVDAVKMADDVQVSVSSREVSRCGSPPHAADDEARAGGY